MRSAPFNAESSRSVLFIPQVDLAKEAPTRIEGNVRPLPPVEARYTRVPADPRT